MTNETAEETAEPADPPASRLLQASQAGHMLRTARLAAGLHIATLAVSLKVPVKKLEALEDGRLDDLPDAVFVRALTASICRTLKMNPQPVLNLLPQNAVPRLGTDDDKAARRQAFTTSPQTSPLGRVSRPAAVAGLLLLLAALALLAFPQITSPWADQAVQAPPVAPAPVQVVPEPVAASAPLPPQPSPPLSPMMALVKPVQTVSDSAPQTASANKAVAVAGAGSVKFRTTGPPSWIEVTDSRGAALMRRTVQGEDVAEISGATPLLVVIGRADVTVAEVNGRAFDLQAVTKENVARFEVK